MKHLSIQILSLSSSFSSTSSIYFSSSLSSSCSFYSSFSLFPSSNFLHLFLLLCLLHLPSLFLLFLPLLLLEFLQDVRGFREPRVTPGQHGYGQQYRLVHLFFMGHRLHTRTSCPSSLVFFVFFVLFFYPFSRNYYEIL